MGKYLFIIGAVIMMIGAILWLLDDHFGWFGNLPGDVKIERENVKIYFPWVTMLLISIVLSLLLWLIQKFGK
ncbi:MAG: DUF2905 domain-containing protein [Bacteroidia bacterium]